MRINLSLCAVIAALGVSVTSNAAQYKPGEVIVKYREDMVRLRSDANTLYRTVGVLKVRSLGKLMAGYEHLSLKNSVSVEDAIASLLKDPSVEYAQPNYIMTTQPVRAPMPQARPNEGQPCFIAGLPLPQGCDPSLPPMFELPTDGSCIIPGVPFPPGCKDGGGGGGGDPVKPGTRPDLKPAPADVNPAVADPNLDAAYGLSKIGAVEAWKTFRGSKEMLVADIDTGIDYNHEDLAFNMWRNPNPTNGDVVGYDFIHKDGLPFDDQGHGTHTSGTIGATGGNGIGVSGVAQRVSVMSVKFLSAQGSGEVADAIRGIDYAIEHGAKILSNSWGGEGDDGNQVLYDAIERAKAKDVLFIAAAGNGNQFGIGQDNDTSPQKSYPAAFDNDNLISVAATDKTDKLAFFSNFGKKSVHLAAPGVRVMSTLPGNKYAAQDGTSMACPHVAGAAALIWAKNPKLTYKQVKEILLKSVDPLDVLTGKTSTGGRLNVLKALASME